VNAPVINDKKPAYEGQLLLQEPLADDNTWRVGGVAKALYKPTGISDLAVFRNPPNLYAAQLIESCGLKGMRVGGAKVSEKHANFIINHEGTACSEDIEGLIQLVQKIVYEKTSVELIREVHIIGDK